MQREIFRKTLIESSGQIDLDIPGLHYFISVQ